MEHTPPAPVTPSQSPSVFLDSKLGIALLMILATTASGWIRDRLTSESRDSSSSVRIEALDARVTSLAGELAATRSGALSAAQFQEFRLANDAQITGLRQDVRDLINEVNAERTRR